MTMLHRLARAAQSAAAAAVLLVALPIVLIAASQRRFGTANPVAGLRAPWNWSRADVDESLRRPLEDDTVVDAILRGSIVIAWAALIVLVVTTVLEVTHVVRHHGLPSPTRPGLGWAQPVARFIAVGLVGLLPLATTAEPIVALTSSEPTVRASSTPAAATTLPSEGAETHKAGSLNGHRNERGGAPSVHLAESEPRDRRPSERIHIVARGESVWSIAESLIDGDDADTMRLAERILDRNLGRQMNDGDTFTTAALIRPGWELILPVAATGAPVSDVQQPDAGDGATETGPGERVHEVEAGDTLAAIAAAEFGDPAAWTEVAELNLGRTMDDGRVFDDPNLILPGWDLILDDEVAVTATPDVEPEPDATPTDVPPAPIETLPTPTDATPAPIETPPMPAESQIDWFDDDDNAEPQSNDATYVDPAVVPSPPSTTARPTTTTTTVPPTASRSGDDAEVAPSRSAPSPLGREHAGMLAGGLLALAAIRRRRRLRSARARARLPEPPAMVTDVERSLRSVGVAEAHARLDVAIRSIAHHLLGTGRQPLVVERRDDGEIRVVLTGPAHLPTPWTGTGRTWLLPASVPVEFLAETARNVGDPCPALVAVGRTDHGELLIDPEAAGVVAIDAPALDADVVVASLASTLATSLAAETAHLIGVGLNEKALFDHPNATTADDPTEALLVATRLVGRTSTSESGTFDLRARRTGGEAWEPAIVFVTSDAAGTLPWSALPDRGHGIAVIVAGSDADDTSALRLRADEVGWTIETGGWSESCRPFGLDADALDRVHELMAYADAHAVAEEPDLEATTAPNETSDEVPQGGAADASDRASAFADPVHAIVVHVFGGISITDVDGREHAWQRSKTVELIAWLATHRSRAGRDAARAAMWVEEIRDATFSNIVSEARRGLARLVAPPDDVEWIPRTLTDELGLHEHVLTDLDLVAGRLDAARLAAPSEAIEILRPAVDRIGGAPFAGTSYLWPDADGLVTDATLLATSACVELAHHALSVGDVDTVFVATGRGLAVLPGHEESIALRMRAHARRGDLAGVRREWESYERVITANAWSDGEPASELLQLRHELLNS